jgi:hypothetical protein
MEPNEIEEEASRIFTLIDELDGRGRDERHWRGYHPLAYGRTCNLDHIAGLLCSRLQKVTDIGSFSLEMQMWWRDHQASDKARIQTELALSETKKQKQEALSKLTPYERKILGLDKP